MKGADQSTKILLILTWMGTGLTLTEPLSPMLWAQGAVVNEQGLGSQLSGFKNTCDEIHEYLGTNMPKYLFPLR